MDQMGKCYHHLGRHEPAEKLFKKAVRLTLSNTTRSDGFYVSKRTVKTTLLLGAALAGGYFYLEREDADRKEIRLLMERSQLSLEKGDIEQSMKEQQKAFETLKTKFPGDKSNIAMAMAVGASYEKTDQFAAAMPFYHEALQYVALEARIVYREDLRIMILDRLGQCCKQAGDPEAAEKHFKQAIEAYDQLKGKLSLSADSTSEPSILSKLDEDVLNVFLHYTVLLTTQQRSDDAARARLRLTSIARGSPQLRSQVAKIQRQVDDYLALEGIREQRKLQELKGDGDSDFV
ncbi:Tetratricopeptide TPR2 [Phytophthora cinnamomi]|uniref:Tetratricopeptide TPR2 n=1 Tax=Phytophthora cinnamomi TaxID=4785 RepID=UPI00355AC066|nr:Tetratricopeptide TPR2 [Phytophthora cinnamomi]